jgi:hypothetical protein
MYIVLYSLTPGGRYYNPIPTCFLVPTDCLKIPALDFRNFIVFNSVLGRFLLVSKNLATSRIRGFHLLVFIVFFQSCTEINSSITGRVQASEPQSSVVKASLALLYSFFWARICKRLWSPGIESKEWIPPAYVAGLAGTKTLFLLGS